MKWFAIVVALAGCQRVFAIKELPAPGAIDAPPASCPTDIGHDDDGDCIGDGSDNCPGIPNPAQLDTDNDKIGDDCDPDPSTVGNLQLAFVPFAQVTEATEWTSIGSWAVVGDDFVNSDSTSGGEDWSYRTPALYGAGNEIEARISVGTFAAGDDVKIGVGFYAPMTTTSVAVEWSCSLHQPSTGAPGVDAYNNGVAGSRPLLPATLFAQDAIYTLRMRFTGTTASCDIRGDSGDTATTTATNMTPPTTTGYLAVFTQQTQARIHSIAVYSAM